MRHRVLRLARRAMLGSVGRSPQARTIHRDGRRVQKRGVRYRRSEKASVGIQSHTMSSPEVPDLRSGGWLGRPVTWGLWLKLFLGIGLVVTGVVSLRDEPRAAPLLIAFGIEMGFPVVMWLRSE